MKLILFHFSIVVFILFVPSYLVKSQEIDLDKVEIYSSLLDDHNSKDFNHLVDALFQGIFSMFSNKIITSTGCMDVLIEQFTSKLLNKRSQIEKSIFKSIPYITVSDDKKQLLQKQCEQSKAEIIADKRKQIDDLVRKQQIPQKYTTLQPPKIPSPVPYLRAYDRGIKELYDMDLLIYDLYNDIRNIERYNCEQKLPITNKDLIYTSFYTKVAIIADILDNNLECLGDMYPLLRAQVKGHVPILFRFTPAKITSTLPSQRSFYEGKGYLGKTKLFCPKKFLEKAMYAYDELAYFIKKKKKPSLSSYKDKIKPTLLDYKIDVIYYIGKAIGNTMRDIVDYEFRLNFEKEGEFDIINEEI